MSEINRRILTFLDEKSEQSVKDCHPLLWKSLKYLKLENKISSMASKPITIRWIRTGSQPDRKVMYSIELQTIFYEYLNKNHKIKTADFNLNIRGKLSVIRCDKHILTTHK